MLGTSAERLECSATNIRLLAATTRIFIHRWPRERIGIKVLFKKYSYTKMISKIYSGINMRIKSVNQWYYLLLQLVGCCIYRILIFKLVAFGQYKNRFTAHYFKMLINVPLENAATYHFCLEIQSTVKVSFKTFQYKYNFSYIKIFQIFLSYLLKWTL